ncbi:MAG: PLP-dependent aminotransferase family protein [Candidatus Dormibacteria bacterium]
MYESSSISSVVSRLRSIASRSAAGDLLPSSRVLVKQLGVSPVTVSRALAVLTAEGAVTTRPGVGTFVAAPRQLAKPRTDDLSWQTIALGSHVIDGSGIRLLAQPPPAESLSLGGGYPHPALTPVRQLAAAMSRAARRPGVWEAPDLSGLTPLRRWFAESLGPGLSISADDVVITSGGQAALSAALRSVASAGSTILVESPTYLGVLAVARAAGLTAVPVPLDEEGVRPGMLADAFAATGARVLYCQPTFQNPTGAVMTQARRKEILEVASTAGAFVIEDDWARWLAHATPAPAPMIAFDEDGRVIHIKSLTKATAPSVRIGALVSRGPVAERIRSLRLVDDLFVTQPLQETALEFVTSSAWPRHVSALAGALRQRRQVMLSAVASALPQLRVIGQPAGGFYVWAELPPGSDEVAVAAAAASAGVHLAYGRPFFAAEPPGGYLRLSFAAAAEPGDIDVAIRRLAAVWP